MENVAENTDRPAAESAAGPSAVSDNVLENASGWVAAVRDRVHIVGELAVAEARLAVLSIGLMAFLAVLAALCEIGRAHV